MNGAHFFTAGVRAAACGLLACVSAHAVSRGLDRVTTESPHFSISVDRSKRAMAAEAAAWLEQAYEREAAFFDFRAQERIQVVLLDEEDFSNGFAYAANSWIVIHLPPARFDLRGPSRWMPNVAAHELGHVITLRKMGAARRFLGIEAFASLGRRDGRTDAEAAWSPGDAPAWLAEGLAQYAALQCGFDTLDAHRAMLLRQAWLSGSLLPLKAMETFSGDARDGELVYNQGFHLVDFLYRTYGRDAMNALMEHWGPHGYNGAFARALGATPGAVYRAWRAELDARFAARPGSEGGPGSERPSSFGPSYAVEGAPFRDAASGTLYYLSSRDNDFGITHLYAVREGRRRLIRRDVNPPLRAGARGSLLFTSSRTEASSGARISDLYRLNPGDGKVERLTQGRRVIAGAESGGVLYALIQDKGRPRLARLSRAGKPARWYDAPEGSEFIDLAGGHSALYLGMVRDKNADILRMDTAGTFTDAAASPRNETDPFYRDGRLYFSADYDGVHAVYSRDAAGLRRHTPPGKPAFAPFADGDSLFYSEYAAGGFRIRALPLAGMGAGAPAPEPATPAEPAAAFIPPPAPPLKKLSYERGGTGLIGYYGTLGYAYTPHADARANFGRAGNDGVYRLNPCPHQGYLGGGALWSDPSLRNQFAVGVLGAQCADESPGRGTHVPYAVADYLNQDFAADVMVTAQYGSMPLENRSSADPVRGALHDFSVVGAGRYHLGNYAHSTGFMLVGASMLRMPPTDQDEDVLQGLGLGLGNTLGFAVLEPGGDFIHQGAYGDATLLAMPGVILTAADAGVLANAGRALFVGAHTQVELVSGAAHAFDGGWAATGDYRIPVRAGVGGAGYRGLFFESLFLRTGYTRRWSSGSGIALAQSPFAGFRGFRGFRTFRERQRPVLDAAPGGNALVPVAQARHVSPQTVRAGVRLKAVSAASRVVFWDAQWEAPPDGLDDGYFSVSLSL